MLLSSNSISRKQDPFSTGSMSNLLRTDGFKKLHRGFSKKQMYNFSMSKQTTQIDTYAHTGVHTSMGRRKELSKEEDDIARRTQTAEHGRGKVENRQEAFLKVETEEQQCFMKMWKLLHL